MALSAFKTVLACALTASVALVASSPALATSTAAKQRLPRVTITIEAPAEVRIDQQYGPDLPKATFTGASTSSRLTLSLADGTQLASSRGRCTPDRAIKSPTSCTVVLTHRFQAAGDYSIVASQVTGKGTKAKSESKTATIKVYGTPTRWKPTPGVIYNQGWVPFDSGATYYPCQTVRWYFDRSGESPDRNTMIDDVRAAHDMLQPLTGLKFTEVTTPADADLVYKWGDLAKLGYPDAAGVGGNDGAGNGHVTFSDTERWTTNEWAGLPIRRIQWDRPDLGPGWYSWLESPGRQALVIHELMHAMGLDHNEDFTSIMYPQGGLTNGQGKLSTGDIAGLSTMYLNNPCPYIPA